jgi:N-formylglutamate amidohydrolase
MDAKTHSQHPQNGKLPIAIILPHAGLEVPPELEGRLAIGEDQIFNEADVYTDLIFDFRDRVTHWVRFPYARALIDVNRPDDPAMLKRVGDGVVKDVTSYGQTIFKPGQRPDFVEERELVHRYWHPWHEQLAAIASDPDIKLVIDAHSMAARGTKKYDPAQRLRPRGCVSNLGDARGYLRNGYPRTTMPAADLQFLGQEVGRGLARIPALCPAGDPGPVILNAPYWGGWDLKAHGMESAQPWAMIEVSRAMYVGWQDERTPAQPPNMEQIEALREALWQAIEALYWRLEEQEAEQRVREG